MGLVKGWANFHQSTTNQVESRLKAKTVRTRGRDHGHEKKRSCQRPEEGKPEMPTRFGVNSTPLASTPQRLKPTEPLSTIIQAKAARCQWQAGARGDSVATRTTCKRHGNFQGVTAIVHSNGSAQIHLNNSRLSLSPTRRTTQTRKDRCSPSPSPPSPALSHDFHTLDSSRDFFTKTWNLRRSRRVASGEVGELQLAHFKDRRDRRNRGLLLKS
ncbi:hypothetical protein F5888DRAFT_1696682 [Russula emetica]|nr:hypothetical protein F5888DRAFT_1696682 [Russula emetica]